MLLRGKLFFSCFVFLFCFTFIQGQMPWFVSKIMVHLTNNEYVKRDLQAVLKIVLNAMCLSSLRSGSCFVGQNTYCTCHYQLGSSRTSENNCKHFFCCYSCLKIQKCIQLGLQSNSESKVVQRHRNISMDCLFSFISINCI